MALKIPFRGKYHDLTLRLFAERPGIDRLDPSLTINSTTVTPTFRYKLGDADTSDLNYWTYGEDLTYAAGGGAITANVGAPGLNTNDDACRFDGAAYYQASGDSFADITTEDIVYEAVFKQTATAGATYLCAHRSGNGWGNINSGLTSIIKIVDAGGNVNVTSAALTAGCWYHAVCFLDRSGSGQWYVNGAASGAAANISAISGTLTVNTPFVVGSAAGGANAYDSDIAYLALWKSAAWLDTHLQATVAAERFARLTGDWPNAYKGTAQPSVCTRSTPAYLDKMVGGLRQYFYVGAEWMRTSERVDADGDTFFGYLTETAHENVYDEFSDFAGWTKADAGDAITDDIATAPTGETEAAKLVCDATDGDHNISDATPGNLTAATWMAEVNVGAGNATKVRIENATIANGAAWFDLSAGTLLSKEAGIATAGFVDDVTFVGDADKRLFITFTGTVAPHTIKIAPADADADDDFSGGDGAAATLYMWGLDVHLGNQCQSPVRTDGAAATCVKDQLRYVAGDNIGGEDNQRGRIECYYLLQDVDAAADAQLVCINDGGSSDDRIVLYCKSSDDTEACYVKAATVEQVNMSATGDPWDGERHRARLSWIADDCRIDYDGGGSNRDTSCSFPDDLDRIDVGQSESAALQFNGLIGDLQIYRCDR